MSWGILVAAACAWLGADGAAGQDAPQPDEPKKVLITLEERRFDVAGLNAPRDFPAVDLRKRRDELEGATREPVAARPYDLSDALRAKSGIPWGPGCAAEVIERGRTLRVVHTPDTLKRVNEWLDVLRSRLSRRMVITATILAADAPRHRKPPMRMRAVTEADARKLIDGAAAGTAEHLHRLNEFRLELIDGQQGNLLAANQVSYLGMPEVTATPYAKVFNPRVKIVLEGLSVEARATWNPAVDKTLNNSSVWLDFRLQAATLVRPIKQMKSPIGTIQFPVVIHQQARGEIRLPERGWAILSGLREVDEQGRAQRHLLFVIQLRVKHMQSPDSESDK